MRYNQHSFFIFFSIITVLLLGIVGHLYLTNIASEKDKPNISWDEASLKITSNWGACVPTFPCYEIYELDSNAGSPGSVIYNNVLQGHLPIAQTMDFIKESFGLYKNNKCTPVYITKITQDYELIIDKKVYEIGNDQGCKEMQDIFNTLKGTVGV